MEQHIGIAVADCPLVMRDLDAAQPQWPARSEAMAIFSNSDPSWQRGHLSLGAGV
jgi:hypothetical protein